ncbi:hypothetical protein SLH46_07895 [Draconibacterium sp. IB214405]|uniref:hypothetical protein n=1 Tax=Draconibacterium sp. IB214405 TaxID=3097352 RepID=UPI002A105FAA|nr:hypothetical protein [Draconibacterium sp. IB214405]MDX8339095.1 hypothetical protein [Draconibacterium sp. IB214405]
MPRKSAWEKLPKSIRSAIVLVILVSIALVITWVLFDKATDNTTLKFKSENMAIFATGSVAVFVLILMVLSKEFRRISAVLTIVGVVGLTATYVYNTNSFGNSFVADGATSTEPNELQREYQIMQEENEQLVAELRSQIQEVEQSKEIILNERNHLENQVTQLQTVINESGNVNVSQMQQQIVSLKQENERIQATLNTKENEIVALKRINENVTVTTPSAPSSKFEFPLSRQDRSFMEQILKLDAEYRERGNRSLDTQYKQRAKEIYKEVYRIR